MSKRKIWLSSILFVVILCCSIFVGYSYVTAKRVYEQGVQKLNEHKWIQSKNYFLEAKKKGIFFYQDGEKLYLKTVKAYGQKQLKLARDAFHNQKFEDINNILHTIPDDANLQNDIKKLKSLNPANLKVQNFISPDVQITKTTNLLFAPDIPGIVVEGTKGQDIDKVANVYVIVYDPSSTSYKVAYSDTSGDYNEVHTKIGKLFNDDRNGVVVDLDLLGASGWLSNTVVLSYDSKTNALIKNLDLNTNKGDTEIKNNKLMVSSPEGVTEYTWNGEQLEGKQVFLQPSVNLKDKVMHYSISNQERVVLDSEAINLKVGEKLVLVRNDQNKVSERIMLDAIGVIDSDAKGNGFIAKAPGTTQITIIPNEYDWEKSKVLKVTVLQ
jgi:hypothetical protein